MSPAWVLGAHVAPYLTGMPCIGISRWQSLDRGAGGEAGLEQCVGSDTVISSLMT